MFDFREVHAALEAGSSADDAADISLPLLDAALRVGVGRDGSGAFVFVGPGQATESSHGGDNYAFDPWLVLVDQASGLTLRDVCLLRFHPRSDTAPVLDAVAAVFVGLAETAAIMPSSLGRTIAGMRTLFEGGLRSSVPWETELGLAGELLVILSSPNASALADRWHAAFDAQFDFSAQGERLEVKTTSGTDRMHWFSSGQVDPIPGVCTSFVSVILPPVEVGSTVASLFASETSLSPVARAKVRSVIVATAHEPPELLTSIVFDETAGRSSLRHIAASAIPAPIPVPGVAKIRWQARLDAEMPSPPEECGFRELLGY